MSIRYLFMYVILTTFSGPFLFAQSAEFGRIKGSIYDQSLEAIVPGISVTIAGNGVVRSMVSDQNGEYLFDVPPGIYEITTPKVNWFFPINRSKIEIFPNTAATVNLYLSNRECSQELVATSKGIMDRYSCAAKNPKFENPYSPPAVGEEPLIEYKNKQVKKDTRFYHNAKLTNSRLTLIAKEIRVDRKTGVITASGQVLVDKNGVRNRTETYTIER